MLDISSHAAVITGATGNLGAAVVRAYLTRGTHVAAAVRDPVKGEALRATLTDVAGDESALRQALPADAPREVWLSGAISPRARAELSQRGWDVHDRAAAMLK